MSIFVSSYRVLKTSCLFLLNVNNIILITSYSIRLLSFKDYLQNVTFCHKQNGFYLKKTKYENFSPILTFDKKYCIIFVK